jgi:hypothetical protein
LGIIQHSPPIQHRGSNALEVSISWPVELNGQVPLKLVVRGRVVRSVEGVAAIEINQREFRTQASQGSTAVPQYPLAITAAWQVIIDTAIPGTKKK